MITTNFLKNNTRVLIHSFGDGLTWKGTIKGIFGGEIYPNFCFYIVELDSGNPWNSDYDCISVPNGCISILNETSVKITHEIIDTAVIIEDCFCWQKYKIFPPQHHHSCSKVKIRCKCGHFRDVHRHCEYQCGGCGECLHFEEK